MATRNIFYCLASLSLVAILSACDSMPVKTRPHGQTTPIDTQTVDDPEQQPTVQAPEFLQKKAPKLGLILGPGGALAYSHIGFLQELENNKVPVHAVAGLEWGALVAGAYALDKKSHSVEWKLLKLPHQNFESKGLFSSSKGGAKVSSFDDFLNKVFKGASFQSLKVPFSCPSANIYNETSGLKSRGQMKLAVRACWASPPHFAIESTAANLSDVRSVAQKLRSQGAEIVVYVDVLSKNTMLTSNERKRSGQVASYWINQKSTHGLLVPPVVDQVIHLNLSNSSMTSYKNLRSIIRMGQVKSKSTVKGLAQQYAY